ncbi:MAG: DEAD/DEAH box helicase family protein [Bacteroidales bacterium]|nr:DEAD/DEAH box helicase family protein [Bacteroidales bacterium]
MDTASYISVILPLKLEWEPCYEVPHEISEAYGELRQGDRVRVTFAGREYIGVVSESNIEPQTDPGRIKPIIALEKAMECISAEEIELWRRVAGYYLCTVGEVYKAAYPIGKLKLEEARAAAKERAFQKARKVEEARMAAKARAEERAFCKATKAAESLRKQIANLQARLEKKTAQLCKANNESKKEAYAAEIERIKEAISTKESALQIEEGRLACIVAGTFDTGNSAGTTIAAGANDTRTTDTIGTTDTPAPTCGKSAEPQTQGSQQSNATCTKTHSDNGCGIILSPAQKQAYIRINEAFAQEKPVLLNGLTGSGKTEIYIRLAMEAMRKGKNVLYLVPEIAVSRQLEDRLSVHFGSRLLTFHSGESAYERRDTAERIRASRTSKEQSTAQQANDTGDADTYIVLGTRSAIFLPHHNLSLVIVDEEHDSSYKQDSPAPRYNGRDAAIMLSQLHSTQGNPCHTILGSATPSLEELFNCGTGRHTMVSLDERYHGSVNSSIEIIDTKAERRKRGMTGSFSRKLIGHINDTLSSGGQVMILRSRRAWAPALQCDNCGDIPKCPHCNVSLSFHSPYVAAHAESHDNIQHGLFDGRTGTIPVAHMPSTGIQEKAHHTGNIRQGYMACHYCGYRTAYTGTCSKCSGPLRSLGAGTQKIEEEAAALFPGARIERLDSDTIQQRNRAAKTIRDFSNGKIDILIGTQMVTKGFDFSNLRLVAVIAADSLLSAQDFRADEKALQILEQFRGRCGRRGEQGLFVIQTSQPEHPLYRRLSGNEAKGFNMELLQERKDFNFPPFTRIVEITIKSTNEARAEQTAQVLAQRVQAALESCSRHGMQQSGTQQNVMQAHPVTGPYAPAVSKIADYHIRKIRVSLKKDRMLQAGKDAIMKTVKAAEKTAGGHCQITIDVDPA